MDDLTLLFDGTPNRRGDEDGDMLVLGVRIMRGEAKIGRLCSVLFPQGAIKRFSGDSAQFEQMLDKPQQFRLMVKAEWFEPGQLFHVYQIIEDVVG